MTASADTLLNLKSLCANSCTAAFTSFESTIFVMQLYSSIFMGKINDKERYLKKLVYKKTRIIMLLDTYRIRISLRLFAVLAILLFFLL